MFKSKGFTAAFIVMSLIAIALAIFLGSLVFGKGKENLLTAITNTQAAVQEADFPETSTEEAVVSTEVRGLHRTEEHSFPVMDDEIPETGKLSIVEGGATNGVTFHLRPMFDEASAEGNTVQTSGTYDVVSKIYIYDEETAYLMYRVADGYYVTSNPKYVSYKADVVRVLPDAKKKRVYGYDDEQNILVRVFQEDGNHLAFSVYELRGKETVPVLENIIASYDAFGTAHFEYKCGADAAEGSIVFSIDAGSGNYMITVRFDAPVTFGAKDVTELKLK